MRHSVLAALFLGQIVIGFALSLILPPPTQAQNNGIRLTTSPLPINIASDPGHRVSAELRVRNSNTQPETIEMGLLKFTSDSDDGTPILLEREPGDDYFDWVTFSENQFTLAPNEWKTVEMYIDIPAHAAFGYYLAPTFSRVNQDVGDQRAVVGSTATLVLLEVTHDGARRDIFIESFSTDKPWYEFLPVQFDVRLRNGGNIHGAASGNIFISKGEQSVATLDVNQVKGNILPNSSRTFSTVWEDGFPRFTTSEHEVEVTEDGERVQALSWNLENANSFRFGKYTAHLVLAYDNGERDVPLESTVEFWVIPWRLILISLAIPIIPAILVYIFMKLRQRRDVDYYD